MEFQHVVQRRRMVRRYRNEPVPPDVVDLIVQNALRAPSAGFSQGTGFLVLDTTDDVERFRTSVTPVTDADKWFAANVQAPLVIVPLSDKDAYLNRYAQPDKGFTDRSDAWWPAPYWDIDAGMAAMLILLSAVDHGLGACFFGIPKERIDAFVAAFGIPPNYRPIGAVSVGYPDEPARDLSARRRPTGQLVRRGRWGASA
jgi:nitroreductase